MNLLNYTSHCYCFCIHFILIFGYRHPAPRLLQKQASYGSGSQTTFFKVAHGASRLSAILKLGFIVTPISWCSGHFEVFVKGYGNDVAVAEFLPVYRSSERRAPCSITYRNDRVAEVF